jgi:hypothetical protein
VAGRRRLARRRGHTGRVQAGFDASAEGLEIVRQLGSANDETSYLALHAWITALLGQERECRDSAAPPGAVAWPVALTGP